MLASYYSQAYDGLTRERQQSVSDSIGSETVDDQVHEGADYELGANVAIAKVHGKLNTVVDYSYAKYSENQFAQELVTSSMHDDIFLKILTHATENNLINADLSIVNHYVHLNVPLQVADLEQIINSYGSTSAIEFMKQSAKKSFLDSCETSHPSMSIVNWEKEKEKNAERHAEAQIKPVQESIKLLENMASVLPYQTFMYARHNDKTIIIPLAKEMYKLPPPYLNSIIDGNVHVFGIITKTGIGYIGSAILRGIFGSINNATFNFMSTICGLPIDENTVFVLPMAIYSE